MSKADEVAPELYALNSGGVPYCDLQKKYHLTHGQISGAIDRYKQAKNRPQVYLGEPLKLVGDYVIVGDVHIPCTNWGIADLVGRVAEKTDVRRLIIAGDFLNQDAFSCYPKNVKLPSWTEERDAARVLIRDWAEVFDEIIFTMGNHDRRLEKWSGGEFPGEDIFGILTMGNKKCKFSEYGYCMVNSGGVSWRVTHPKNYGRNQLVVASDLANKYSCNVWSLHEHHLSLGYDVYGKYICVNGGGLYDPDKMAYVCLDDSRSAGMIPGFGMLKDGVPTLYGKEPFTDWGRVLA
jgi:predicted phosphodiesterase